MTVIPSFGRKEVRELAQWLADQGWQFIDWNSKGHTIWKWPASGDEITLPETPRGYSWKKNLRDQAHRAMGTRLRGKTQNRQRVTSQSRLVAERRAEQQRVSEWAKQCDELDAQIAEKAEHLDHLFATIDRFPPARTVRMREQADVVRRELATLRIRRLELDERGWE